MNQKNTHTSEMKKAIIEDTKMDFPEQFLDKYMLLSYEAKGATAASTSVYSWRIPFFNSHTFIAANMSLLVRAKVSGPG